MQTIAIIGLGNAPKAYWNTRHNAGFILVDRIGEIMQVIWLKKKLAWEAEFVFQDYKFKLVKLNNYINLSGEMLQKYFKHQNIDPQQIWLCSDNIDIDFGKIKYNTISSGGSHNGLRSINQHFSNQCHHLRIGIKEDAEIISIKDYVLADFKNHLNFTQEQILDILSEIINRSAKNLK